MSLVTSVLVLSLWTRRGAWYLVSKEGADGGLGDGCLRWLLSRGFRREVQVLERADAGEGLWCLGPARGLFDLWFSGATDEKGGGS